MTVAPPPTLHNQYVLNDDDFVANFVARQDMLETLCRRIAAIGPEDDGQHQILIGVRGMGKSSFLRRLAIEINRSPKLSERFIPLMFREEQYNVLRLRDFWRNCGESLAEWAEGCGLDDLAARLDSEIYSDVWADDDDAAEQFHAVVKSLGKRAVLLIDNLDLILDSLPSDAQWSLRGSLQARGGPILIGAATHSLSEAADRNAAFYEFFQPCHLDPLELPETEACMRTLAKRRGEAGQRVIQALRSDPGRLRVLHRLTGGNPRVLALTYRLLESADSHSAMADLERLLDEVTPYYKARVEDYQTPLQRAVIDAIALHWDPVTTGELSTITGVSTTTLSPQLTRLRKDGFIEKTETSGSYAGHQIVERFLNIWYLMRHGTRRTKQRMRWLVAFLSSFYTRTELVEIDREARKSGSFGRWTSDYAHAFEQAMQIAPSKRQATILNTAPGYADQDENEDPFSTDVQEALAMFNKGTTLGQHGNSGAGIEIYDALIARFSDSDSPHVQEPVVSAMFNKGVFVGEEGDPVAAIKTYDALILRYSDSDSPPVQERVVSAMINKGVTLGQYGDPAAAIEAYDTLIARYAESDAPPVREQVARAMLNKGFVLGQQGDPAAEVETYNALIARYADSDAPLVQEWVASAMFNNGVTVSKEGDPVAAIEIYDALIARYGDSDVPPVQEQVASAMVNKGATVGEEGDPATAIETYDALIARYSDSDAPSLQERVASAMLNKGFTLGRQGDHEAAIKAYDVLVARYSDSDVSLMQELAARAMANKGITLGVIGEYLAEIACYEQAIAVSKSTDFHPVKIRLANRLKDLGIDSERAEALFLEVVEYNAPLAHANLFWLYLSTGRSLEAEETLVHLDSIPAQGRALMEAALALKLDNFGEAKERLELALQGDLTIDGWDFSGDLERLIRFAIGRGYGERLIAWFEETRFSDRFAPIHSALKAAVHGETQLLDVNPETRDAASLIYRRLLPVEQSQEKATRQHTL